MPKIMYCPCCGEMINVAQTILTLIDKVKSAGFTPLAVVISTVQLYKLIEEIGPKVDPKNNVGEWIMFAGLKLKMDDDVKKIRIEVEA